MLIISILLLLLYSSYNKYNLTELKGIIFSGILVCLYTLFILINSNNINVINTGIEYLNNSLLITPYTIYIKILVLLLGIIYLTTLYYNNNYVYKDSIYYKEYIILVLTNILSVNLIIESSNLLILFVLIELQSYTLYLITTSYYKDNNNIIEASPKNGLIYFLLGSLASIIILLGISLIYYETGLINLIDLTQYFNINNSINTNNKIIVLGILFMIIGLLFKIGSAPLHNWIINIYVNSPTIVTMWISLITKISIFTILYNILSLWITFITDNEIIISLLNIMCILSMIIGSLGGLAQISVKSIIAYSGLANIGYILYILIGMNHYTIYSYILYIYQYSLTHMLLFIVIILYIIYYPQWIKIYKNNKNIINNIEHNLYTIQLRDFIIVNKGLTLCLIIGLVSLMGIPPLAGFYGKYFALISGLLSGYWFTGLILIISSMITAVYYAYIIYTMINSNNYNTESYSLINNIKINKWYPTYNISYLLAFIAILILIPNIVLDIYLNGLVILDYYQWIV